MSQQGAEPARDGIFNSRVGPGAGRDISERAPFEQLLRASVSVLVCGGSVVELSASERLENNESGTEASVRVDPWL